MLVVYIYIPINQRQRDITEFSNKICNKVLHGNKILYLLCIFKNFNTEKRYTEKRLFIYFLNPLREIFVFSPTCRDIIIYS